MTASLQHAPGPLPFPLRTRGRAPSRVRLQLDRYAMLCYAMLCYAMLCYAMLLCCYAMRRYDFSLIGDISSVGNTIEALLCAPPKHGPPSPPSPPPSPPGPAWSKAAGKNCWGSRGGQPAHGASDLEQPPSASCGEMSLGACEAKCNALQGCTGIVVAQAAGGLLSCYRKADIHLGQCAAHPPHPHPSPSTLSSSAPPSHRPLARAPASSRSHIAAPPPPQVRLGHLLRHVPQAVALLARQARARAAAAPGGGGLRA